MNDRYTIDVSPLPHADPANVISLGFIHPNLFLTSLAGARGITGDVSLLAFASPITTSYMKRHPATYRGFVDVDDTPHMRKSTFKASFSRAARLIKKALDTHDRPVVVHCHAGVNRSVCGIMAFVRLFTDLNPKEVLTMIEKRNITHRRVPALRNPTFARYLPILDGKQEEKDDNTVTEFYKQVR